jgi:hypothetical protein
MEYRCPICGSVLHVPDAHLWDHHTAPLVCDVCLQGFWLAEVTPEASAAYDKKNRTHRVHIRVAANQEHEEAVQRKAISKEVQALMTPRQHALVKERNYAVE